MLPPVPETNLTHLKETIYVPHYCVLWQGGLGVGDVGSRVFAAGAVADHSGAAADRHDDFDDELGDDFTY